MKYLVCEQPGQLLLKEKEAPKRLPGTALVRIKKVGVCGTDLHAYQGNQAYFQYPRILGHELAAEVLEIESNQKGLKAGDAVTIIPYVSCNRCYACRHGKTNCCTSLQVLGVHTDGGMQEVICVPVDLLLPADGLTDRQLAVVEPLAIGAHALHRAALQPGEWVLVMGCGPIGLGILLQAQQLGARVIAMDANPDRLEYARKMLGISNTLSAGADALSELEKRTDGDLAAAVFDATGNKKALESGPAYMAAGGRYILVGLYKGTLGFEHPAIHAKETSLLCSRNATPEDFEQVMAFLRSGAFPLDAFITHELGYQKIPESFDTLLQPEQGVIKALINF